MAVRKANLILPFQSAEQMQRWIQHARFQGLMSAWDAPQEAVYLADLNGEAVGEDYFFCERYPGEAPPQGG